MRMTLTASVLALAIAAASPAIAQEAATASAKPAMCPGDLGKKARNALATYNDAVNGTDAAQIAAGKAAARAEAKTDAERCVLAQIEYNVAVKAGDDGMLLSAIEALAANPVANKSEVQPLMLNAAKIKFQKKDYAGASAMLDKIVSAGQASGDALIMLAESRFKTGRQTEAPALALKAIEAEKAAGRKVSEDWYKHAVAMAYEAKSPMVVDLSREWVAVYPSPQNWTDALRILQQNSAFAENDLIDVYRLQMATKSLSGTADYGRYANLATKLGLPGETQAAIKAGIAAGDLSSGNAEVAGMLKTATGKIAADKASLASATAKAIASGNPKVTLSYGDVNYGYGEYAKAAEAYRAAAGMSGADVATANLRLGMALAMAGDKAGATDALKAVTGPKAPLAAYWLAYVNSRG